MYQFLLQVMDLPE